ncbi:hypothetical protein B4Q04_08875 [Zobellia sp. OII3]|uniref:hypothetical protein n=1 Tax=Zobellia sp. OII3 TaxID=2034520 RepID=UPI000B534650|nr:hypothetical protein [Zobellia sp. OII3]OWW25706.1 hypothetical protein B4Q04_08875 [Zobellia sp. OII3]
MKTNVFFIICFMLISQSVLSQNTYWKYEKTKTVLATAIDIEAYIDLFTENDYAEYNPESKEIILYMYEANMKPTNLKEENEKYEILQYSFKINNDRLKILIRAGVDDIYFITFRKVDMTKKDFRKKIKELKD